jgi:hypothetical protein
MKRFRLGVLLIVACIISQAVIAKTKKSVSTTDALILETLWKVIAREGKSKNYGDLLKLDGGTVGIAHFAVGGLENLYKRMDTKKYFNRSQSEMINRYTNGCRPKGRKGNDSGWGCYSKTWWREGMRNFLNSPESIEVQKLAYLDKMRPVVEKARQMGWKSTRELAIAIGISNSIGSGGFNELAGKRKWDSEKVLKSYVGKSAHRQRRMVALNEHFPTYGDSFKRVHVVQVASAAESLR